MGVAFATFADFKLACFDFFNNFVTEVIGFVLIPCFLFAQAVRHGSIATARLASVLALIGIIINRLNISIIAFNWKAAVRYYPTWMEIVVTLMIIFMEIWVFRWIVNRMPVLRESNH